MAISKVVLNGDTLMDATTATAEAEDITAPKTAMLASGEMVTGTGSSGASVKDIAEGAVPVGVVDLTGVEFGVNGIHMYNLSSRPNITRVIGEASFESSSPTYSYTMSQCQGLTSINLHLTASYVDGLFQHCHNLITAVLTIDDVNNALRVFVACYSLEVVDINASRIRTQTFYSATNLQTIILRSESLVALENTNAFQSTPFASGGAGGTIYLPKVLYDHLGDGTSLDYKAATNWSTIDGYGTITWAQLEGSQYETQYADGTPITE